MLLSVALPYAYAVVVEHFHFAGHGVAGIDGDGAVADILRCDELPVGRGGCRGEKCRIVFYAGGYPVLVPRYQFLRRR